MGKGESEREREKKRKMTEGGQGNPGPGRSERDREKGRREKTERKLIEAASGLDVGHCSEEDGVRSVVIAITRVVGGENIPDGREKSVLEESCEQWLTVLC